RANREGRRHRRAVELHHGAQHRVPAPGRRAPGAFLPIWRRPDAQDDGRQPGVVPWRGSPPRPPWRGNPDAGNGEPLTWIWSRLAAARTRSTRPVPGPTSRPGRLGEYVLDRGWRPAGQAEDLTRHAGPALLADRIEHGRVRVAPPRFLATAGQLDLKVGR